MIDFNMNSTTLRETLNRLRVELAAAQARVITTDNEYSAAIKAGIVSGSLDPVSSAALSAATDEANRIAKTILITEGLLSAALEDEARVKHASDCEVLTRMLDQHAEVAQQIDAATVALADLLTQFEKIGQKAHDHVRLEMGRTPIPGTPTIDTANAIGAYVAQSASWNPSPHKPAATIRAGGFARNARNAAGVVA